MSHIPANSQNFAAVVQRLRRVGWVMLGDQALADRALERGFAESMQTPAEMTLLQLFELAYDTFDAAALAEDKTSEHQPVAVLGRARPGDGDPLVRRLVSLDYASRVATALVIVEDFSLDEASFLSGMPRAALRKAADRAVEALSVDEADEDDGGGFAHGDSHTESGSGT